MPLRIELKPNERLILNGASIRNGDRRTSLLVETQCRFLRESEILRESEADTVCKRLCVTLQAIYMSEPGLRHVYDGILLAQMKAVVEAAPTCALYIADINELLEANQHHKAIKCAKMLIAREAELMGGVAAAA